MGKKNHNRNNARNCQNEREIWMLGVGRPWTENEMVADQEGRVSGEQRSN